MIENRQDMLKIGIRHEDKYESETRTPLIPIDIQRLINDDGIDITVESSNKRVYQDDDFRNAGAHIGSLDHCDIIIGVKEVPIYKISPSKVYLIFSHVIKGQKDNMPSLKKMMELNVTLIDYEKIVDEHGKRLIFFGRYAGLAGMINSLWTLGKRLAYLGLETPFLHIRQARTYHSLEEAKQAVGSLSQMIKSGGLSQLNFPLVIGFTGNGNVSKGAWEIMDLLPVREISNDQLLTLQKTGHWDDHCIYKVVFTEKEMVKPRDASKSFDLIEYYANPSIYESDFEKYLDKITLLVNGAYWDDRYPRIVTKNYLRRHYNDQHPLKVIADISCDANGSIECTEFCTKPEDPVFVYNPLEDKAIQGFDHDGLLVMAVDILPSELPKDSSAGFSSALFPYIEQLSKIDFSLPFELSSFPEPLKKATILYKGELTTDFEYLRRFLD